MSDKKKTTLPTDSPWRPVAKAATALRQAAQTTKDATLDAEHNGGSAAKVREAAETAVSAAASLLRTLDDRDTAQADQDERDELARTLASGEADGWSKADLLAAAKKLGAAG